MESVAAGAVGAAGLLGLAAVTGLAAGGACHAAIGVFLAAVTIATTASGGAAAFAGRAAGGIGCAAGTLAAAWAGPFPRGITGGTETQEDRTHNHRGFQEHGHSPCFKDLISTVRD